MSLGRYEHYLLISEWFPDRVCVRAWLSHPVQLIKIASKSSQNGWGMHARIPVPYLLKLPLKWQSLPLSRPEPDWHLKVWLHNIVGFYMILCCLSHVGHVCLSPMYLAVDLGLLDLRNRFPMHFYIWSSGATLLQAPKILEDGSSWRCFLPFWRVVDLL